MSSRRVAMPGVPGNERIATFSDGVFAIAITLLVLELKVPEPLPPGGVEAALPVLWPRLAAHLISFLVLGVYWIGHHSMFQHIHRHNRLLLWLNLIFLMFVAAVPFSAALITNHPDDTFSLLIYAVNLALAGFSQDAIWRYANSSAHLAERKLDPGFITFVDRRILAAPAIYLVCGGLAFVSHLVAGLIFILVPLMYILPSPVDQYHHRQLTAAGTTDTIQDE